MLQAEASALALGPFSVGHRGLLLLLPALPLLLEVLLLGNPELGNRLLDALAKLLALLWRGIRVVVGRNLQEVLLVGPHDFHPAIDFLVDPGCQLRGGVRVLGPGASVLIAGTSGRSNAHGLSRSWCRS
jgi:hypothetical protein